MEASSWVYHPLAVVGILVPIRGLAERNPDLLHEVSMHVDRVLGVCNNVVSRHSCHSGFSEFRKVKQCGFMLRNKQD